MESNLTALLQQICQGDALKEIINHLFQALPHGHGLAAGGAAAALAGAGHRSQITLGQLQDRADGVLISGAI